METLLRYFPGISAVQGDRFRQFAALLEEWNERINLISRKDTAHLFERHILHSLAIAGFIEFRKGQSILDIGTGGGFPGIPLAILFPDAQFILMDSIGKKIRAVEAMCAELDLQNVSCIHGRAENYTGRVDFVVARAVTNLPVFCSWIRGKFKVSANDTEVGLFYLKGGELAEELMGFRNYEVYALSDLFSEPFFETKKLIFIPTGSL